MDKLLTKDADKMLCEIYAAYLERRKSGISKALAKSFFDQSKWSEKYSDSWHEADARDTLRELKNAGFLKLDICGGFGLQDEAIVYMESRFKNGLNDVLDFLGKIISAISLV